VAGLYAALLKLTAEGESDLSPSHGYHAYGLFLSLIRESSPRLADELHNSDLPRPFTVSTLHGKLKRAGRNWKVIDSGEYSLRLTFLREDIFAHFMDGALKAARQPLRLESATFHIQEVALHPRDSLLCGHQTYEELIADSSSARKVTLRFLSPTTFRSGGKRNVLFPDASLVFGSYLARWQHYSPVNVSEATLKALPQILVARYRLTTHILDFNAYQETGFEGQCTFELPAALGEDLAKTINALADFAFYCGTGAKTTMGMGQTRRIK
jgi:CRISPR-associated endoribonuclease Cas6